MDDDDRDAVWDELDDIELGPGDSAVKAAECERRAASSPVGSVRWAELLAVAADHRGLLGEHGVAIAHLESIRDSGTWIEPSAGALLISAHLDAGQRDDAMALEGALRRESADRDLGGDYNVVGEAFEEAGDLKTALRWFNLALRDVDPDDLESLDRMALNGHWRVRRALGLPEDQYDAASAILRAEATAEFDVEGFGDADGDPRVP